MSNRRVPATRGYEVRRVYADGKPLGIEGFGLEIVGVRTNEHNKGKVWLGREGLNDGGLDERAFVPASVGRRQLGYFQTLRYDIDSLPGSSAPDFVEVKVITDPKTVWIDTDPSGKPRSKFFTRTPGADEIGTALPTLASGAAVVLFDGSQPQFENDRFWTDERFETAMLHYGIITADNTFKVWVYTRLHPFNGFSTWKSVQEIASRLVGGSAAAHAVAAGIGCNVIDFTVGAGVTTTNTGNPIAFPPGNVKIVLENISGVGITYEYMLGVKGHA